MVRKQLVLVVDDDTSILRLVRIKLQAEGYQVITASNGQEAVELVEREHPDLVVLDLMMPVMDGMEALRQIRRFSRVPVILLTARSSGADKVRGLDLGADDYVTKPFDPDELAARVAAVLRRAQGVAVPATQVLRYPEATIDLENRRVTVGGEEVALSRTEWELLAQLASNAGRVMPHGELLARIWGPEFRDETYYLRTWVSRLRKKLQSERDGSVRIKTYPGIGYRLEPPAEAS
ncbi:MAG TPA: response regulator transcription factor [Thermomicrobiaceae bacterium]|nr:response regulator transcription factor [Thermomicrobiaceae bacterium]